MYWVEMLDTGDAASMSPGTVNVLGGNVRHWDAASKSPGTVNVQMLDTGDAASNVPSMYTLGMLPVCHQVPSMYWVEMLDTGDAASMSPGTVNVLGGNVRHWGRCQYVTRYRQCTGWKC